MSTMSTNSPGIVFTPDLPVPWVRMADGTLIISLEALEKMKPEKKG